MKFSTLIVVLFVTTCPLEASAEWIPPENPDPHAILNEARADQRAGRHETALAKHVWYYNHALEHNPGLSGVRLSFALGYWLELARVYPPALEELENTRDRALARVTEETDRGLQFNAFHDMTAINRTLKEEQRTVAAFISLEEQHPEIASHVYRLAQPALIKAREYPRCGKYLDGPRDFRLIESLFDATSRFADRSPNPMLRDHAHKTFVNSTSTLVALLVIDDRHGVAVEIAERARQVLDSPELRTGLEKALEGIVPAPWP